MLRSFKANSRKHRKWSEWLLLKSMCSISTRFHEEIQECIPNGTLLSLSATSPKQRLMCAETSTRLSQRNSQQRIWNTITQKNLKQAQSWTFKTETRISLQTWFLNNPSSKSSTSVIQQRWGCTRSRLRIRRSLWTLWIASQMIKERIARNETNRSFLMRSKVLSRWENSSANSKAEMSFKNFKWKNWFMRRCLVCLTMPATFKTESLSFTWTATTFTTLSWNTKTTLRPEGS